MVKEHITSTPRYISFKHNVTKLGLYLWRLHAINNSRIFRTVRGTVHSFCPILAHPNLTIDITALFLTRLDDLCSFRWHGNQSGDYNSPWGV